MDDIIIKNWKEYGYPSADKLYKILKADYPKIKRQDIVNKITEQETAQVHRKLKKNRITGHFVSYMPNETWIIDLLDLQKYAKSNNGFRFILIIIDVFSRRAYGVKLKNKEQETVARAFESVINKHGAPLKLVSDNGTEFLNSQFREVLSDHDILHQTVAVGNHNALGIIDAFSKTIKQKIFKHFTASHTSNWVNVLENYINKYNDTPHTGINDIKPNQATKHLEEIRTINREKNILSKRPTDYKVGQKVRIRLNKAIFTKGYEQTFSNEVFTIIEVKGINALLDNERWYKLSDLLIVPSSSTSRTANVQKAKVERKHKVKRKIAQEGVQTSNITRTLRTRKPENQLEDVLYGKIKY